MQQDLNYQMPRWLRIILVASLGLIVIGFLNDEMVAIFVGIIGSLITGVAIGVDYFIEETKRFGILSAESN